MQSKMAEREQFCCFRNCSTGEALFYHQEQTSHERGASGILVSNHEYVDIGNLQACQHYHAGLKASNFAGGTLVHPVFVQASTAYRERSQRAMEVFNSSAMGTKLPTEILYQIQDDHLAPQLVKACRDGCLTATSLTSGKITFRRCLPCPPAEVKGMLSLQSEETALILYTSTHLYLYDFACAHATPHGVSVGNHSLMSITSALNTNSQNQELLQVMLSDSSVASFLVTRTGNAGGARISLTPYSAFQSAPSIPDQPQAPMISQALPGKVSKSCPIRFGDRSSLVYVKNDRYIVSTSAWKGQERCVAQSSIGNSVGFHDKKHSINVNVFKRGKGMQPEELVQSIPLRIRGHVGQMFLSDEDVLFIFCRAKGLLTADLQRPAVPGVFVNEHTAGQVPAGIDVRFGDRGAIDALTYTLDGEICVLQGKNAMKTQTLQCSGMCVSYGREDFEKVPCVPIYDSMNRCPAFFAKFAEDSRVLICGPPSNTAGGSPRIWCRLSGVPFKKLQVDPWVPADVVLRDNIENLKAVVKAMHAADERVDTNAMLQSIVPEQSSCLESEESVERATDSGAISDASAHDITTPPFCSRSISYSTAIANHIAEDCPSPSIGDKRCRMQEGTSNHPSGKFRSSKFSSAPLVRS